MYLAQKLNYNTHTTQDQSTKDVYEFIIKLRNDLTREEFSFLYKV